MTLTEFKAWFEGFTENLSETPTKLQWDRIKSRVKEIDGTVTTYPVFVDRYYPNIYPRYVGPLYPCTISGSSNLNADLGPSFNSAQAMYALGTADANSTV